MNKIETIKNDIMKISKKDLCLMEVCGTHTMSIARTGIRSLLPKNIKIISGPGCPVCVTPSGEIHAAIQLARNEDFIIATFGDMLKVPSGDDFLQNYKNVKVVYSPLDSLKLSKQNPDKEIIFLGIGFETTAPLIASTIRAAKQDNLNNFSVLCMHKIVPPAIEIILKNNTDKKVGGLILPGHVSAITGRKYFDFIKKYKISGVVSGFEATDIMSTICLLVKFYESDKFDIVNNYKGVVSEHGNKIALDMMNEVFDIQDSQWRGIGLIKGSGLTIRNKYKKYDAADKFNIVIENIPDPKGCRCGEVLMAKTTPKDCTLFGKACTPSNPVGPCMVSSEGTCAAFYKYDL